MFNVINNIWLYKYNKLIELIYVESCVRVYYGLFCPDFNGIILLGEDLFKVNFMQSINTSRKIIIFLYWRQNSLLHIIYNMKKWKLVTLGQNLFKNGADPAPPFLKWAGVYWQLGIELSQIKRRWTLFFHVVVTCVWVS